LRSGWNLRFSGLERGLLLNFRTWPLKDGGIKRVIKPYARPPSEILGIPSASL